MINYTPTPDYYNEYICHYNHNHDPKNGQFTTGHGSFRSMEEPKVKKVSESNQDMFNDLLYDIDHEPRSRFKKKKEKEYNKLVKSIAKENKINKKQLDEEVKSKYEEREFEIAKKTLDQAKETVNKNKQKIADEVAKGMVGDLNRWSLQKRYIDGDTDDTFSFFPKDVNVKSISDVKKHLKKEVLKNIDSGLSEIGIDMDSYDMNIGNGKNSIEFIIDAPVAYQPDKAPITVSYNPETKNVKFWWT